MSQEKQRTIESEIEYLSIIRPELKITADPSPHTCGADRSDEATSLTMTLGHLQAATCVHSDHDPVRAVNEVLTVLEQGAIECHTKNCKGGFVAAA